MDNDFDIVIVGTGVGGGTLVYALKDSGAKILLIERGGFLPQEPENWIPTAVFDQKRYKPDEKWLSAEGEPFSPGVHYFVGGNTKVFGAAHSLAVMIMLNETIVGIPTADSHTTSTTTTDQLTSWSGYTAVVTHQ